MAHPCLQRSIAARFSRQLRQTWLASWPHWSSQLTIYHLRCMQTALLQHLTTCILYWCQSRLICLEASSAKKLQSRRLRATEIQLKFHTS